MSRPTLVSRKICSDAKRTKSAATFSGNDESVAIGDFAIALMANDQLPRQLAHRLPAEIA